jgi:hypothetical protein
VLKTQLAAGVLERNMYEPGCVGDIDGMLAISGCGSALAVGELHRLAPSSSTARIF